MSAPDLPRPGSAHDPLVGPACRTPLHEAHRTELIRARTSGPAASERLADLYAQRRKLLALHYEDKISADQFGEEQARITTEIENLEAEATHAVTEQMHADEITHRSTN